MSSLYFVLLALVLLLIELSYFALARRSKIIDLPNDRSLHSKPTIRGGGIIFPIAILLHSIMSDDLDITFMAALVLVASIGMADDAKGIGRGIRFGVQSIAMLLIFYGTGVFAHSWWVVILLLLIALSAINTYNFMDGINGITSGYSLVIVGCLYYINSSEILFVSGDLLIVIAIALLIFSFFNFRKKAVCFAGDVGSLSMGFTIIYLILKLTMLSHNYIYVMLLAVYGIDSFLTIIHRLVLRQNIFDAHRLHLYQVIVSNKKMSHLVMTAIYMLVQLVVSLLIISHLDRDLNYQYLFGGLTLIALGLMYIILKWKLIGGIRNVVS